MARKFLELNAVTQLYDPADGVAASAGISDAFKLVLTRGDGTIDPSFIPQLNGGLVPSAATAGATLEAGMFVTVYMDGTTKKVRPAQADNDTYPAFGFVKADVNIGDAVSYFTNGDHIFFPAGTSFLTANIGQPVWLSPTVPGGVTMTRPTTQEQIAQKVGVLDSIESVNGTNMAKIVVALQPYILLAPPSEAVYLTPLANGNFEAKSIKGLGLTYTQDVAIDTWTIDHSLGFRPHVTVFDAVGDVVQPTVSHPTVNRTVIKFGAAVTGSARLS